MPDLAFLDANVIFSAAHSSTNDLRQLWSLPNVALITSPYALIEVHRNLPPNRHADLHVLLHAMTIVHEPAPGAHSIPSTLVLPAKDVPIFQAAAAARATHLLTGDKRHFGAYYGQRFDGVLILPPHTYLRSRP